MDYFGEVELMSSIYISLADNFKTRAYSFGYGINYSKNNWDLRYYGSIDSPNPPRTPVLKSTESIGITLDGYYRIGQYFNIGLIYRPTLLRVKPTTEIVYEHLISVDLLWKWRITK